MKTQGEAFGVCLWELRPVLVRCVRCLYTDDQVSFEQGTLKTKKKKARTARRGRSLDRKAHAEAPREQLLAAAVDYAAQKGLGDVSLRQLATELRVSHRMLIYHFGSKQELLTAVVTEVERRQREAFADLQLDPAMAVGELARQMWKRFADPSLWPLERLFFELYGQALQGREHTEGFLRNALDPWMEMLTQMYQARGLSAEMARAAARLGIAGTRGLLLDLLATRDRRGVDRAMELFIDLYELLLARSPGSSAEEKMSLTPPRRHSSRS